MVNFPFKHDLKKAQQVKIVGVMTQSTISWLAVSFKSNIACAWRIMPALPLET